MKTKKGISLIVLVITIIVMIILAAAVIISLTDSDLIDNANTAVKDTDIKQVEHIAAMAWSSAYIKKHKGDDSINLTDEVNKALVENGLNPDNYNINVTEKGVIVTAKGETVAAKWELIKTVDAAGQVTSAVVTNGTDTYDVGTVVNYMPAGINGYTGSWQILGADDDGRLLILPTDGITGSNLTIGGTDYSTTKKAYIDALTTIQNAVNGYKDGTIGIDVRSITIEDIEKLGTFDESNNSMYGKQLSFTYNNGQVSYTYENEGKTNTSDLVAPHDNGFVYYDEVLNEFKTLNGEGQVVLKMTNRKSTGKFNTTQVIKNMIFGEMMSGYKSFWIVSRYISLAGAYVSYGIYSSLGGNLNAGLEIYSYDTSSAKSNSFSVRPVVTLASDVKLTESTTAAGTYDLSK